MIQHKSISRPFLYQFSVKSRHVLVLLLIVLIVQLICLRQFLSLRQDDAELQRAYLRLNLEARHLGSNLSPGSAPRPKSRYLNTDAPDNSNEFPCEPLPGASDIMVALRTGANNAKKVLPPHFNSTLRCIPNYAIFSDLEEEIEGHHVTNALRDLDTNLLAANPDFQYYQHMQQRGRSGFSHEDLDKWDTARNSWSGRDSPGWRLDKWKFLPIVEKAFHQKPDAKWYVFIEADSYIIWPTLLEWLSHFDSAQLHYIGNPMVVGETVFAYGGAGFVISNPALRRVLTHWKLKQAMYNDLTSRHWAGDCVLGKIMADAGIPLFFAWPNLLGDSPEDMDYGAQSLGPERRPWCNHVVSWHHLSPSDILRYSRFEQQWRRDNGGAFLRHSDVFKAVVLPQIQEERTLWDNLSDLTHDYATSLEHCRDICKSAPDCLQYSHSTATKCKTTSIVKLGRVGAPPQRTDQVLTSGWMVDRIDRFVKDMDEGCRIGGWAHP